MSPQVVSLPSACSVRYLVLGEPIKTLGAQSARVELHTDVIFELTVDVVVAE